MSDCGSTVQIVDGEASAWSLCTRPAGHDGPHGNGELRWQRLDQSWGKPLDEWADR